LFILDPAQGSCYSF